MQSKRFVVMVASAAFFMAVFAQKARAHDEPVAGTLVGAGIGAVVAGPPGAAVGAVVGAIWGATVAHENDHGRHAHPHAVRREVYYAEPEPVAYARPVAYPQRVEYAQRAEYARPVRHAAANTNGYSEAYCEPKTRVVYVEGKPRAPATKTKVKKVCKNVVVKEHLAAR